MTEPKMQFPSRSGQSGAALIVGLILMVVLSALATIQPAGMGPQADPLNTPNVIKPEWFFFATFRWLKITSLTFAVLSTGFAVFLVAAWPFVDKFLRDKTRLKELSIGVGVLAFTVFVGLTVWEALELFYSH